MLCRPVSDIVVGQHILDLLIQCLRKTIRLLLPTSFCMVDVPSRQSQIEQEIVNRVMHMLD